MKTVNPIDSASSFLEVETEFRANQQIIIELEAKQAKLRNLLSKRTRPYPRPAAKPVKQV